MDKNISQESSARTASNEPPRRWNPYAKLPEIEAERRSAIEEIFVDEFAFIDDCLALAARQVEILGDMRPANIEDVAIRDLSCDAFEFLYEARRVIAENRPSIVFPLMRRAFESVSLCHLFMVTSLRSKMVQRASVQPWRRSKASGICSNDGVG